LATNPMLRRQAAAQPKTLRSVIDAFSSDSSRPGRSGRRDRVHDSYNRVDPLYGIIVCVFWEFCEFFSEYGDFFVGHSLMDHFLGRITPRKEEEEITFGNR